MTNGAAGLDIRATAGVLRVVLARPERHNALTATAMRALADALVDAATAGTGLRVVCLGATGPDFCAGGDLAEGADATGDIDADASAVGSIGARVDECVQRLIATLWELEAPIVAAVRGRAVGLGGALVLVSDLVVAGRSARLRFPFTQRGFSPDSGVSWLLPRAVGIGRAKRALLLGEEIGAAEALSAGLVDAVVDDDEVDALADEWTAQLSRGATVAIGHTKRLVRDALATDLATALSAEADALDRCAATADFREGLVSFLERREPRFEGR